MFSSSRVRQSFFNIAKILLDIPIIPIGIIAICIGFFYAWAVKIKDKNNKPRLFWGATPIKSLAYMAESLKALGYVSDTAVVGISTIYAKKDFDHVLALTSGCGRVADWMLTNLF